MVLKQLEAFAQMGVETSVVELAPHVIPPLEDEIAPALPPNWSDSEFISLPRAQQ